MRDETCPVSTGGRGAGGGRARGLDAPSLPPGARRLSDYKGGACGGRDRRFLHPHQRCREASPLARRAGGRGGGVDRARKDDRHGPGPLCGRELRCREEVGVGLSEERDRCVVRLVYKRVHALRAPRARQRRAIRTSDEGPPPRTPLCARYASAKLSPRASGLFCLSRRTCHAVGRKRRRGPASE